MVITVDPPPKLPVDYLSLSSLKTLMTCPEKWKRRYIEKELEPPSGRMVLGGAAGAALAQHYGTQIETGAGLSTDDLLDEFSGEWEDRLEREPVELGTEKPGAMKDSAAKALAAYHRHLAPDITPVSVEREFRLGWPGVDWQLAGFIDLEDADGMVRDYKMLGKRMSRAAADADLQPTVYLAARIAEGNPPWGFRFDTLIWGVKQPTAEIVPTERSGMQLDLLTDRIFNLAREIEWRCETDTWAGAAPSVVNPCSMCRYSGCPLRLGREP